MRHDYFIRDAGQRHYRCANPACTFQGVTLTERRNHAAVKAVEGNRR